MGARLRILLVCVLAACAYGVAHDLLTAHLCVEYFTIGHPRILITEEPLPLALFWGVFATWWVGAGLGAALAWAAGAGPAPAWGPARVLPGILRLLASMGGLALLAGLLGGWLASGERIVLLGELAERVPAERHARYLACLWAHTTSYAVGALGGLALVLRTRQARRKELPASNPVSSGAADGR